MSACAVRRLAGWGGVPAGECCVFRPERVHEVRDALLRGGRATYLARGLGRSYGDAALNEGQGVLSTLRLDRMLAFDEETGALECEAGVSFADLLNVFLPRGFFPPVTPGTRHVTIGGAVAADVHGKNHAADGSFGRWVDELTLMTADGQEVRCSRTERPDLFWATVGGMGLTGVILRARIRLRRVPSAWMETRRRRAADLDAMLAAFDDPAPYAMAWIDGMARGRALGRGVLTLGRHAEAGVAPGGTPERGRGPVSIPFHAPSLVLNHLSIGAFNRVYGAREASRRDGVEPVEKFFYPLDAVGDWNRMYGRRGFVQYQFAVPFGAESTMAKSIERMQTAGHSPFLVVLKKLGPAGEGLLSFPREGWTLAMDIPARPGLREAAAAVHRLVADAGGRVYLAKDALLGPEIFREMVPAVDRFREIKRAVDPEGRFSSSLARRVGLADG